MMVQVFQMIVLVVYEGLVDCGCLVLPESSSSPSGSSTYQVFSGMFFSQIKYFYLSG